MEIIKSCVQGSAEWLQLRAGSIGGTRINKIAPEGKGRNDELFYAVGELLTGVPAENFKFQHADRGHQYEDEARQLWLYSTGMDVEQVAMITGDPHCHYSPDGLVSDDGMIEIKTRIPSVWLKLAEGGTEPIADRRQRQWGFIVTGRKWIESINYCPEIAAAGLNGMIVKRVLPDHKMMKDLKASADLFISDMLKIAAKYTAT